MLRWRFKRDLALGLGFLCLSASIFVSNTTTAVDGQVEVEVGIKPVLTVTAPANVRVLLQPDGPVSIAEIPVNFISNNSSGIYSTFSLDTVSDTEDNTYARSLINEYDPAYYIAPLEESVVGPNNFPFDRWGCAFGDDMRFEGLSTSDAPSIHMLTHDVNADNNHVLYCGARASKLQAAGVYSATILISSVPNVVPDTANTITYMQDINDTVIASMQTDNSYQLVDKRDKKIYWVTKLRDGRVWMTQNLDYDAETHPDAYPTLAEWGSLYPENPDADINTNYSALYKDGGNYYYDVDTDQYKDSSTLTFGDEKAHYKVGSFYNINTNRTRCEDCDSNDPNYYGYFYQNIVGICPYSWGIPDNYNTYRAFGAGIFNNLLSLYPQDTAANLYLAPMGYVDGSGTLTGVGSSAYYITNIKAGTGRLPGYDALYLDARKAINVDGSYNLSLMNFPDTSGGFIRCVATPNIVYTVTFANANISKPVEEGGLPIFEQVGLPEGTSGTTFGTAYTYHIDESLVPTNIPEGFRFIGWSNSANYRTKPNLPSGNATSYGNGYGSADNGVSVVNITIYPVWEYKYTGTVEPFAGETFDETRTLNNMTYMQDLTPEIVSNTEVGSKKQLIDSRDNKKYWVTKMDDGNIWMEQDLNLNIDEVHTLTPDDSAVSDTRELSNNEDISWTQLSGGYNLSSYDINNITEDSTYWRRMYGGSYNLSAITAGTYSEGDSVINESICPRGWTLPSLDNMSNVFYYDVGDTVSYQVANKPIATSSISQRASQIGVSHTRNISDDGVKQSDYGNSWRTSSIRGTGRTSGSSSRHVISSSSATSLIVDLYYAGESCCDYVSIYNENTGSLVGNYYLENYGNTFTVNGVTISNVSHTQITINGNSVGFEFYSDGSVVDSGFGYYAVVRTGGSTEMAPFAFTTLNQESFTTNSKTSVRCVAEKHKDTTKELRHISTMQEMRPEVCAATPIGTEVQLKDVRDNKTYFVRKMSDGNCWMVQNLAYIKSGTLNSRTSNLTGGLSKKEVSYYGSYSTDQMAVGYYTRNQVIQTPQGYNIGYSEDIPMDSNFKKYDDYVYYTYAGALDACPRGWRLPTSSDPVIPDENESRETLKHYTYSTTRSLVSDGLFVYLTSDLDEDGNIVVVNGNKTGTNRYYKHPARCIAK